MAVRLPRCDCKLDFNDQERLDSLESSAIEGDLRSLRFTLDHIKYYDYWKDIDPIFVPVENRIKNHLFHNVRTKQVMLDEITTARKAMEAYRARMSVGIPPRRPGNESLNR